MLSEKIHSLPPDKQIEVSKGILRAAYKASLFHLSKFGLGYSDMSEETHGDMVRVLESPSHRKLIVMPRGTFKSSIGAVAYSIWLLINNPNLRILYDSEVYTNSKNALREIKQHLESQKLTDLFGAFRSDSNWTEGSITIAHRTKNLKESSITCSGVGATKVGQHFDVIIGDDYNSNKNSETQEGREKIILHYRYNLSILEPNGTYVLIGTRYAINDIIGHILSHECEGKYDPATGKVRA